MGRGAVILFEADDLGAGKVAFEFQDIFDLRAAPRIDRLVVVADAGDVLALLREQAEPEILDAVGVLIFVHHDVFESLLIVLEHVAMGLQDDQHVEQQVAKIAGVEGFQARLIGGVEFLAAAIGVKFGFSGVEVCGREPLVLPAIDQPGERASGPAFLVEIGRGDQLFEQAELVVGVENGEIRLQPDQFGVATQHLGPDRVEGAEPRHPLHHVADQPPDAFAHFAGGLVGEGDAQDFARPCLSREQQMGEARGERGGLSGARACEDEDRAVGGQHRLALGGVQAAQIGRIVGRGGGESHSRTVRERGRAGQAWFAGAGAAIAHWPHTTAPTHRSFRAKSRNAIRV